MLHFLLSNIKHDDTEYKKMTSVLRNGGIMIYPTDTVYGLGADIENKEAVMKIYRLKKRAANKPMSFICSDFKQIGAYALLSNEAFRLMKRLLPGPYTFIAPASPTAPKRVVETKRKTVGIRMPDHDFCLNIVKGLGHPLLTTSVNESGETPIGDPEEILNKLGAKVDVFVDGGILGNEPSTIIDVTKKPFSLVRQGAGKVDF